jgi:predicted alpha/beta-hydrolase family hydrolase
VDAQLVPTPVGNARILVAPAHNSVATVVLGHGAGGGVGTPDLMALVRALPARGLTVVRVEQPWHVAGRQVAPVPPRLDAAWRAVIAAIGAHPLVVGGRSAGARVACRTARELGAAAVVALAFPLHPPGRPDRSRLAELLGAGVPTLVVQGERDSFGPPAEFPPDLPPHIELRGVPAADHSFRIPKSSGRPGQEVLAGVAASVADWALDQLSG